MDPALNLAIFVVDLQASRGQEKTFFLSFSAYYFLDGTFTSFSRKKDEKLQKTKEVTKR
jgi:hypothetical protein